jgi:hypothetical protein
MGFGQAKKKQLKSYIGLIFVLRADIMGLIEFALVPLGLVPSNPSSLHSWAVQPVAPIKCNSVLCA